MSTFTDQLEQAKTSKGFIAALDQSGGSTPKALKLYGIEASEYDSDAAMFDLVHAMRTRIITNAAFTSERILGAILFQDTLDREIGGMPTSHYLWKEKGITPILKIDKGLADEAQGVQLMKPNPGLDDVLDHARSLDVFGTKMRSVIKSANADGIRALVEQQFSVGKQILGKGLVPIIEPEVDITNPDKSACEELLRSSIHDELGKLESDLPVMFKLTLPDAANFYADFIGHPKVVRVVALSGGYSRDVANEKLAANTGMIASFSRALTEGLSAGQSDAAFTQMLDASIESICTASRT